MPIFGNRGGQRRGMGCGCWPRVLIALVIAAISLFSYYRMTSVNPITGEKQRVALTAEQEVAMGLQAREQMAQEFDGLSTDEEATRLVKNTGAQLMRHVDLKGVPYQFEFHVLADRDLVNAFALPGGQIFITEALLSRMKSTGQLAGVLGHEIGHVLERHSNEQIAKAQLAQGLSGAAVVAAWDPNNPAPGATAQVANLIASLTLMSYGREAELESDKWGVDLMVKAGYDPRAMIEVMKILAEASGGGGGGQRPPEWASTHPTSETRIAQLERIIAEKFPNGVPEELKD